MDWLQIDGKEIPLLEAPQKYENPPRRILYVIFKHKKLIRNIFLLLIVPMVFSAGPWCLPPDCVHLSYVSRSGLCQ